jgi:phage tail-like protein
MAVNQGPSMAHIASDPLRNFKFLVKIQAAGQSAVTIGYMSVSGLNVTTSVIAYREGGMNTVTQKIPGQSDFSPIVLSRGVAVGNTEDIAWMKQIFAVTQGSAFTVNAGNDFRRNLEIDVLGMPVTGGSSTSTPILARFYVYNAWPTSVAFSDLDAGANQLLISQMSLAHEGWDYSLSNSITMDAPTL